MTIAELFVNLGVKGDGDAQKSLSGISKTLGTIKTDGLAAKAGILGLLYGIQQVMSHAMQLGSTMLSYAGATGMSAESLQRWQYAASLANVGAEEMQNSFTGLQSAMIRMTTGQGVPSGMGAIGTAVGIDPARVRDTVYMMEKLREYAKKESNIDFANEQLKSFGLSLGMISAMRRGMLDDDVLAKSPILGTGQLKSLDNVKKGFTEVGKMFEIMVAQLSAKHGGLFVTNLKLASKELIGLMKNFANLIEKTHALELVGKVFEGWSLIFKGISETTEYLMSGKIGENTADMIEAAKNVGGAPDRAAIIQQYQRQMEMNPGASMTDQKMWLDQMNKALAPLSKGQTVNQTNHIHGVKDAHNVPKELKKLTNKTARQMSAQKRAN